MFKKAFWVKRYENKNKISETGDGNNSEGLCRKGRSFKTNN